MKGLRTEEALVAANRQLAELQRRYSLLSKQTRSRSFSNAGIQTNIVGNEMGQVLELAEASASSSAASALVSFEEARTANEALALLRTDLSQTKMLLAEAMNEAEVARRDGISSEAAHLIAVLTTERDEAKRAAQKASALASRVSEAEEAARRDAESARQEVAIAVQDSQREAKARVDAEEARREAFREASEARREAADARRDARRDVEEQRLRCETAVSKAAEGAAHALAEALRERDEARAAERTARENAIKASEAHAAREAEHRVALEKAAEVREQELHQAKAAALVAYIEETGNEARRMNYESGYRDGFHAGRWALVDEGARHEYPGGWLA